MSTALGDLIVKLSANSTSFQSEIARATRLSTDYHNSVVSGSRQAEAASRQSQRALASLNSQLTSVKTAAASMAGVFVSLFAVGNIIDAADQWGQYQSRIKMTTGSVEEFRSVQARLLEISDRTYKNIDEQAELYIRSSSAMKDLGYSTKGTIDFIDSISSSLTINAASAEKGQSAINALSKSMVTGKVSGEQWNTVMEVMPTVIGDIARYLGTTETAVKSMAANSKLSMDTFAKATIAARQRNAELAEAMPTTVGDAITKLNNHFKTYITDVNASSGATQALSGVISFAADHMDVLAAGGAALAAGGAAKYLASIGVSATGAAQDLLKAQREQIGFADAQYQAAQAAQYKATIERRAAQAALDVATGTDKQRAATLALVQARKTEEAAINGVTIAQTRLNAVTNIAGRVGAGLLSAVGGLPGLAMMAVSAAAGFLLLRDNSKEASQGLIDMGLPVDELTKKFRALGDVQRRAFTDSLKNDIANADAEIRKSIDAIKIYATGALPKTLMPNAFGSMELVIAPENQQSLDRFIASLREVEGSAGGIKNLQGYMQANFDEFAKATNMSEEQRQGLQALASAYVDGKVKVEGLTEKLREIIGVTNEATAANNGLAASLNIDFSKQLTSAKLALDVSKLAAKGATKEAELLRGAYAAVGDRAEELAPQIQKIVASGGKINVAPGLEGVQEWVQLQAQIQDNTEAAKKFTEGAKKSGTVANEFHQKIANLNKEIQVEAVRLKDGDAAAALFSASLEAGTKWTAAQREELIQMNKALAEAKQRWEDHNAAIANDPYRAAAETQKKANEQLQRQIADGEIKSAEDIARRKQDINTAYLQAKAEADQRYAVSGTAELAGNVDPIQNLDNQLAKRHALIESYAAAGVVSQERANQLIVASDRDAMEQRYQASLQLYASQGDMQKAAVDVFQTVQERGVNMLTGLLTKTQDWKEGMSNLFASFAQSAIKNLMDVAAQALWTSSVMQTITGVAGGLMGGISGAASGAAGAAAGAAGSSGIGAMGMSTSFAAYDLGGFTGQGGKYEPAGVVHKGEFVFTKEATERIGVDNLYGMMRGYANGGLVSPSLNPSLNVRPTTASLPPATREVTNSSATIVNITINSDGQSTVSAPPGMEQVGGEIGQYVDQRIKAALQKETGQGRMLSTLAKGRRS